MYMCFDTNSVTCSNVECMVFLTTECHRYEIFIEIGNFLKYSSNRIRYFFKLKVECKTQSNEISKEMIGLMATDHTVI